MNNQEIIKKEVAETWQICNNVLGKGKHRKNEKQGKNKIG